MEIIGAISLAMVSARFVISVVLGRALVKQAFGHGHDVEVSIGPFKGLRFVAKKSQSSKTSSPGGDDD